MVTVPGEMSVAVETARDIGLPSRLMFVWLRPKGAWVIL